MARMIRRFNISHDEIKGNGLLKMENPEIVYEIIKGIFYGIEKNQQKADLFEISDINGDVIKFSIPKSKWKSALEKCLSRMIEIEDYEICSEIKKKLDLDFS